MSFGPVLKAFFGGRFLEAKRGLTPKLFGGHFGTFLACFRQQVDFRRFFGGPGAVFVFRKRFGALRRPSAPPKYSKIVVLSHENRGRPKSEKGGSGSTFGSILGAILELLGTLFVIFGARGRKKASNKNEANKKLVSEGFSGEAWRTARCSRGDFRGELKPAKDQSLKIKAKRAKH